MDPNAAWKELSDAYQESDMDRCAELANGLAEWLRKGGYPPTLSRHQAFDRRVVELVCDHLLD